MLSLCLWNEIENVLLNTFFRAGRTKTENLCDLFSRQSPWLKHYTFLPWYLRAPMGQSVIPCLALSVPRSWKRLEAQQQSLETQTSQGTFLLQSSLDAEKLNPSLTRFSLSPGLTSMNAAPAQYGFPEPHILLTRAGPCWGDIQASVEFHRSLTGPHCSLPLVQALPHISSTSFKNK